MERIEGLEDRVGALESRHFELTDDQIDKIADRAAQKALNSVYAEVGKNVLKKAAWLVGVLIVSGLIFLAGRDALIK